MRRMLICNVLVGRILVWVVLIGVTLIGRMLILIFIAALTQGTGIVAAIIIELLF